MNQPAKTAPPKSTARSALLFGLGTLTSRILGLYRDSLIFSYLPLDVKDAWFAAFRLPNFFRRFLGEGGLSVSFIPIYVSLMGADGEAARRRLANGVFTLIMSLVLLIAGITYVFMEPIIRALLSGDGFTDVPGKIAMTVNMAQIMIFFLIFVTLFAYFMALLNSHKKFGFSGFAPLFLNLSIICGLLFFKSSHHLAEVAAYSVVVGGALQALFLLPPIIQLKITPKLSFNPLNKEVKRVFLKFVPTLFGVGILQIINLVNVYFASRIQGAISYMYLGDRLLELPLSLIAVSIGTALLPTLSDYWSRGEKDTFLTSVSIHLNLFYFLAIPSAFGLWFMGVDIIDVLFQRGEFHANEVAIVAAILKIYCVTLLAAGSLKILNQALFATGDTTTPAVISAFGLILHLIQAPYLMQRWGLNGLVLSTALVTSFNCLGVLIVLQKKVALLHWRRMVRNTLACLVAASAMGFYLFLLQKWSWKTGRFLYDFPMLIALISLAGGIYFVVAGFLCVEELHMVLRRFKKRL